MARRKTRKSKQRSKIRRFLTWLLLIALLWPLYILGGRALCYLALREIEELTNTNIETEAVSYHANGSVFIKKLSITPSQENQDDDNPIFKANEVAVRFSLASFFSLSPRLKIIDVNDFVFDARYNLDEDRWNLSALKIRTPRERPEKMPRIQLKSGILRYAKVSGEKAEVAVSLPLDAEFGLDEDPRNGYKFEVITAAMASSNAPSRLTGFWKPGRVEFAGGIASVNVPEFEMAWIIDVMAADLIYGDDNSYSLKLRVDNLRSLRNPSLNRLALVEPVSAGNPSPFSALQRFFDQYQPSGRIDIDLDARGSLDRLSKSALSGKVLCRDVAICYHKFQYAIEEISGRIDFTNSSVRLRNLMGRHGDVRLSFNGWSRGFGPDWKYLIRITSDNMPLDNDLYDALNPKQQEFWDAFSPAGSTAIDYRFSRNSPTDKRKRLILEPRGAEAIYCKLLYPLKNLTGKITLDRDEMVFSDVVSRMDDHKITLNGKVKTNGTGEPTYDLTAKVQNLPLDSTLQNALPKKQRELFRQFRPAGLVDGWIRFLAPEREQASFTADLSFKEASLKLDRFTLPITDISAKILFSPGLIVFKEFSGRYDDCLLSLSGQIEPNTEPNRPSYNMSVRFEQAVLNDELFALLPESAKKVVTDLNPTGRIDFVADLDRSNPRKPADCYVTVHCLRNSISSSKLPHRLKNIEGAFTVDGNVVRLKDLTAALDYGPSGPNDPATIKVNGVATLADGTFESAILELSASDILFDEPLSRALPHRARGVYDPLASPGRFDLDLEKIQISREKNGRTSYDFDGAVTLERCGFQVSGSRIELSSVLNAKGLYHTDDGFENCRAKVVNGTLKIMGKTIDSLSTNILFDPNEGSWSTKDLVADFYGGNLKGKLVISRPAGRPGEYVLQTGFNGADLKRFLAGTKQPEKPEKGYTTGQMNGSLCLNAQIGKISTRIGTCRLTINDMQVGKLSPLAKLLNVLQLSAPKDFAFEQMLVDSYIRNNELFVRKLDISGQNHAFAGSGLLDLQDFDIDLKLTARGKRPATEDPSVLASLTEGLGQAVVRIDVSGNIQDPEITTETLPVIRETLQVFGSKTPESN
jgi:hypothetical protein